ncbi:MAG: hypothetical protein HZA49_07275 [Planctomycetes bacterium]|nr:hypothetical protein [Planctomycetota bacterium]
MFALAPMRHENLTAGYPAEAKTAECKSGKGFADKAGLIRAKTKRQEMDHHVHSCLFSSTGNSRQRELPAPYPGMQNMHGHKKRGRIFILPLFNYIRRVS